MLNVRFIKLSLISEKHCYQAMFVDWLE